MMRFKTIKITHLPVYDTAINMRSDRECGSLHPAAHSMELLESQTFSSCLQTELINSIKSQTLVSVATLQSLKPTLFFPCAVIRCLF